MDEQVARRENVGFEPDINSESFPKKCTVAMRNRAEQNPGDTWEVNPE
jgi:hypothetical protein